jgi:hypothetical protein
VSASVRLERTEKRDAWVQGGFKISGVDWDRMTSGEPVLCARRSPQEVGLCGPPAFTTLWTTGRRYVSCRSCLAEIDRRLADPTGRGPVAPPHQHCASLSRWPAIARPALRWTTTPPSTPNAPHNARQGPFPQKRSLALAVERRQAE